jgi:hypothetical protein
MIRTKFVALAALALAATAQFSHAAVIMSHSPAAPVLDAFDEWQLLDTATIPQSMGNLTPGGGNYNQQAYSDNAGPPGQTFTTNGSFSIALPKYRMLSVSLKGANTGGGNFGGFTAGTVWGLRISSVSGTTLTPIKTLTGIATPAGITGNEWFTWSLSGLDVPVLDPSAQYAFEVYSDQGYLGFDAHQGDGNYLQGTAFNSAGPIRSFSDNTTGNLANHGYDRTFVVNLTPAVPEPTSVALVLGGLLGLPVLRRRFVA